jgi:F0F1-type ATP synthase membrane subunit b/b'
MCHEFWRYEQERAEEEEARKRAQEMIDKARVAPPTPKQPVTAETEEEAVPA